MTSPYLTHGIKTGYKPTVTLGDCAKQNKHPMMGPFKIRDNEGEVNNDYHIEMRMWERSLING